MAYSTLIQGDIQQTAATVRRFEAFPGESFQRLPNYHYIHALIEGEVMEKVMKVIRSALETFSTQGINSSVAVQFWAATKCSKCVHLLTTTCQPFGFFGNNKELQAYRIACLHHKLYVYKNEEKKKGAAFDLSGHAFLKHAIQHTQDVHDYQDAIFENTWRSYSIPVIDLAEKCFGVLGITTDSPDDAFGDFILAVSSNALQLADLQYSFSCNPRNELEMISGRSRKRTTMTSNITEYRSLVPYMGLPKEVAARELWQDSITKKLEKATAKEIIGQTTDAEKLRRAIAKSKQKTFIESTFRNIQKNVGIPEWPRIRVTTARATSVSETQRHQTVSETSPYVTPIADLTSISEEGIPIVTGDIKALVACPNYDVEYQGNNAPIKEDTDIIDVLSNFMNNEEGMDIDYLNADMDLIANNTIWENVFHEQSFGQIYNAIPSAQETRPRKIAFQTGGDLKACSESAPVNEDVDPNLCFDFDSYDWGK